MGFCPIYIDAGKVLDNLDSSIDRFIKKNPEANQVLIYFNDDPSKPDQMFNVREYTSPISEQNHTSLFKSKCDLSDVVIQRRGYTGCILKLISIAGVKSLSNIHSILPSLFDIDYCSVHRSYLIVDREMWLKNTEYRETDDTSKHLFTSVAVKQGYLKHLLQEEFEKTRSNRLVCRFNDDMRVPETICSFEPYVFETVKSGMSACGDYHVHVLDNPFDEVEQIKLHIFTEGSIGDAVAERILFPEILGNLYGNITVFLELIRKAGSRVKAHVEVAASTKYLDETDQMCVSYLNTNDFPSGKSSAVVESTVREHLRELLLNDDTKRLKDVMSLMTKEHRRKMRIWYKQISKRAKEEEKEEVQESLAPLDVEKPEQMPPIEDAVTEILSMEP